MKMYLGKRLEEGCEVYVQEDGEKGPTYRPLHAFQEIRNHSPDGFNWGYAGSGPAQLALAILADCLGPSLPPTVCPYCHRDMTGTFCRECGYDFDKEDKWANVQGTAAHYQDFKRDVISRLLVDDFQIAEHEVKQWVRNEQFARYISLLKTLIGRLCPDMNESQVSNAVAREAQIVYHGWHSSLGAAKVAEQIVKSLPKPA